MFRCQHEEKHDNPPPIILYLSITSPLQYLASLRQAGMGNRKCCLVLDLEAFWRLSSRVNVSLCQTENQPLLKYIMDVS